MVYFGTTFVIRRHFENGKRIWYMAVQTKLLIEKWSKWWKLENMLLNTIKM